MKKKKFLIKILRKHRSPCFGIIGGHDLGIFWRTLFDFRH
jgi:hypothetical protein